ncbi:MAG: ABC transporter permease [Firmicutes bacterium]|nr:ABC transporter permease [Bacillota bacterium]
MIHGRMEGSWVSTRPMWTIVVTTVTALCLVATLMVLFGILERRREYRELYGEIGTSVIVLHNEYTDEAENLKVLDYEGLREIAGKIEHVSKVFVKYVNPEYRSVVTLLGDGNAPVASSKTAVTGVNAAYSRLRGFTMKEGRFFQEADESRLVAVISEDFARVLGGGAGDRVRLLGKEFEIIGIIARPKPKLLGIGVDMEWIEDVFVPVEIMREEAERYFAAEARPSDIPRVRVYLVYDLPMSDAITEQSQKLLKARFGGGNVYLIGQATTAYGYIRFLTLAFGAGLLLLFGICLLVNVRSLTAFYSLRYIRSVPVRATNFLLIAAGTGGVLAGAALSHLLMVAPVPLVVPSFLSLVIALPLQLFLTKRTLRYMQLSAG